MEPTAAIVVTTILDPVFLDDYRANFERYGHLDRIEIFVIPDRKTPPTAYEHCRRLRERGMRISCPTLQEQADYLTKFNGLSRLVPYDSDSRRNIGFLMALESGADFLISIDDDNYCTTDADFFGGHSVVCQGPHTGCVIRSSAGWYNVCEMLELEPNYTVYARGFPYHHRHRELPAQRRHEETTVRMNAGLWLSEPDLDALSWMVAPVRARAMRGARIVLGSDTWSPVNTQNTSLHRDIIVSYYFVRMGYPLAGVPIDRYGDILGGYFSQACVKHLGYGISVGLPVVEHRRNAHNYMRDAANEFACIWVLEELTEWLRETQLEGGTCAEAYLSLSEQLEDAVESFSGAIWNDATRGYFHQVAYCMRRWTAACKTIA